MNEISLRETRQGKTKFVTGFIATISARDATRFATYASREVDP